MNDTSTIIQLPEYDFDTTNGSMCFSDHKGSNIVLYFYPKDNTSGCTQESVDFKEYHNEFQKQNCVILGISRDSIKSHQKFIDKYELPFTLISDPDEQICTHFDVMKLKNMYGKQYRGIERSTFLINSKGNIVKTWRKVKVAGHVKQVLEQLNLLNNPA